MRLGLLRHFSSLRTLTESVLARNYATLSQDYRSWRPEELWAAVRTIVAERLAKLDVITPRPLC